MSIYFSLVRLETGDGMQTRILALAALAFFLLLSMPLVSAFGEVAGPIIFSVQPGSSQTKNWGIFDNDSINVTINATGDAAQFITYPQTVTLLPNDQITWIPITATIPSGYSGQTNITGDLFALEHGQPGQVQINLQLEKALYIVTSSAQTSSPSSQNSGQINNGGSLSGGAANETTTSTQTQTPISSTSSSTSSSTIIPTTSTSTSTVAANNFLTGLFALTSTYYLAALFISVVVILVLFSLIRKRNTSET